MNRVLDISTSALVAQRQRMNTIAGNIANINTTRNADGEAEPFQRRLITFSTQSLGPDEEARGAGVEYEVQIDTDRPPRMIHNPGHPDADADGNVRYPDINLVTEFTNALEASRAYEANVAAIGMTKEMANATLRILA